MTYTVLSGTLNSSIPYHTLVSEITSSLRGFDMDGELTLL